MQKLINLPIGKCLACNSNCLTCDKSTTFCLSCPVGYSLVAAKCISNQNIGFIITFVRPTASSTAAELQAFQLILGEIRLSLAVIMGSPYNSNSYLISFTTLTTESVIVGGILNIPSSNPKELLNTVSNNVQASAGYGGFSLGSTTFVDNGFSGSGSSSSEINLPLILGIDIPLTVIFIIVVVVVIVKVSKKNNDIR